MWEYIAFRLWEIVGGPQEATVTPNAADQANDAAGAAGLRNARGAERWELVTVVPQSDPSASLGTRYVAYMKRQVGRSAE